MSGGGVTPVENGFKVSVWDGNYRIVGTYGQGSGEFLNAHLYASPYDATKASVYSDNGVLQGGSAILDLTLQQTIINAITNTIGKQVENIDIIANPNPINVGETLPNWDSYILCQ